MPMFIQGLAGLSRRMYDGGQQYAHASDITHWNEFMTISAFILGLAQIPFILNIFITLSTKNQKIVIPGSLRLLNGLRLHHLFHMLILNPLLKCTADL